MDSESLDEEDQASAVSRFLEGYREGRTERHRLNSPSLLGYLNSLIGIRTVYILVFVVAIMMLIQTMSKGDDEPPPLVHSQDQVDHAISSVSDVDSKEHRSGKKED